MLNIWQTRHALCSLLIAHSPHQSLLPPDTADKALRQLLFTSFALLAALIYNIWLSETSEFAVPTTNNQEACIGGWWVIMRNAKGTKYVWKEKWQPHDMVMAVSILKDATWKYCVSPESQNRSNEEDHRTINFKELLKRKMNFLSKKCISFPELFKLRLSSHLPEGLRWEAWLAALQGPTLSVNLWL